ncbi:hypothetical protein MNEG_14766 [Monoraphidium neglectum]|uniref:Hpc2-related domain-containing protein n=1 Tax=Monoraphidium neglectum TaxID=145388 RepID=A0A0D2KB68_9CHLO|nr:hypothetical protein MNEG_14766 [Monoraphidium neglectum]KIY93198.1 hypothetical protein MNEG_14766 [Monoraphidium neglectum]|eukprot:XP_013892218.1 hypothetical protein MNEG_14766 [Monoraphidium neglectum]
MAQRQPQQAPVRKRITPQLVHPLDPGDASPADAAGAVSSAVSVWRIAPAVAPADPDAFSKLGPGRRIYVDLEACGHIADWRALLRKRGVSLKAQQQGVIEAQEHHQQQQQGQQNPLQPAPTGLASPRGAAISSDEEGDDARSDSEGSGSGGRDAEQGSAEEDGEGSGDSSSGQDSDSDPAGAAAGGEGAGAAAAAGGGAGADKGGRKRGKGGGEYLKEGFVAYDDDFIDDSEVVMYKGSKRAKAKYSGFFVSTV